MKKSNLIILLIVLVAFSLQSCSDDKIKAKNMEQIYKEEGVPVKVKTVTKEFFEKEMTFNSVLSGIKETSVHSMIGERVEKVNVKVGQFVKKNQTLVTFPTDNPSAQYFQAKVAYENSNATYERYKNLFETGGISQQQLDNIKTQFEVNKANWRSVKKMIFAKAPISGFVTKVNVRETENIEKESLLFTIADITKLKAKIGISENEIDNIKPGDRAIATWNGRTITGEVVEIDLAMDRRSQSFYADVVLDNKEKTVKAGITASIKVINKSETESIIVERKNIISEGDKHFVYLLKKDIAEKKEVKLGRSNGLFVEIMAGINDGENLIVEGQLLLNDNSKVKVIK